MWMNLIGQALRKNKMATNDLLAVVQLVAVHRLLDVKVPIIQSA